jgi:hypothetical protein
VGPPGLILLPDTTEVDADDLFLFLFCVDCDLGEWPVSCGGVVDGVGIVDDDDEMTMQSQQWSVYQWSSWLF